MKRHVVAIFASWMLGACALAHSEQLPKANPFGIAVGKGTAISTAQAVLGAEISRTQDDRSNQLMASYNYSFKLDKSLDGKVDVQTVKFLGDAAKLGTGGEEVVFVLMKHPSSPRTVDEVKKDWGPPYSEGVLKSGAYGVSYRFDIGSGTSDTVQGNVNIREFNWVTVVTSGPQATTIEEVAWYQGHKQTENL